MGNLDCFRTNEIKLNMKHINSWQDIDWDILEDQIFRLQLRIFKAAENWELNKVHKLQTCLISSHSARYLSIRKIIFDNSFRKIPGIEDIVIISPAERFTLSKYLSINGVSSTTKELFRIYPDGKRRILYLSTVEDRAKQMLAYLALYPQWEAQSKLSIDRLMISKQSLGYPIRTTFFEILKKPKWTLKTSILQYFQQINYLYLIKRCNTFPKMQNQLKVWLKLGILNIQKSVSPSLDISQRGILSVLLLNIALYDLDKNINRYSKILIKRHQNNLRLLIYIRYNYNFIIIYTDENILKNLQIITKQFINSIGLKLYPIKAKILSSQRYTDKSILEFRFLGFHIIQISKEIKHLTSFQKEKLRQDSNTLIYPSNIEIHKYKLRIREIIQKYRGTDQKKLIQHLNPLVQKWTLAKRTETTSKIFQNLDQYLFLHLWKWARKRHSKMSKFKLRDKYWYKVKKKSWIFGLKLSTNMLFELQSHSKIHLQRYIKITNKSSLFVNNLIYSKTRTYRCILIPSTKMQLIKKQKGHCINCGRFFKSTDVIENENIIPYNLKEQKKYKNNVQIIHNYCHLKKTKIKMLKIHRNIKLK